MQTESPEPEEYSNGLLRGSDGNLRTRVGGHVSASERIRVRESVKEDACRAQKCLL